MSNPTTPTGRKFRIMGFDIEEVTSEPCRRADQYMRGQDVTCTCSRCKVDNAGMTQDEIKARMSRAYR